MSRTLTPRLVPIVVLALILIPSANAANSWVQVGTDGQPVVAQLLDQQDAQVRVLEYDDAGIWLTVDTPGLAVLQRKTAAGDFVELTWPDAAPAGEIGAPALPVIRRLFTVPAGASVSVDAKITAQTVFDGAALGLALDVIPRQAPIEKLPGARENAPFDYDASAYAADVEYLAESVTIEELGIVRGQRLFLLEIHPVAYNPAAGTVTFRSQLDVVVNFDGATAPKSNLTPMPGLNEIVLNPADTSDRGVGNYLIVVSTTYESNIASFAAAKAAQGFAVNTHVVSPGTSASTIKSYIQGLWGGADSPDYILLVGDTNTIPAWTGQGVGSPDTDIQYGCMDGASDWYPDIAVGRFPVRSSADVTTLVDKTLYYENGPLADPYYKIRAVFMASVDNYQISEGTHNYVINTHLQPNDYECDKLYQVTYGADTQDVRNSFNDGRFYGVFSGHGSTTSWADGPSFSQSDVNNLTNDNMFAFVCSFACSTGDFAYTECFMETWVLATDGAACSWGSSVSSYWTEDDILEKVLFDAIFDDGDDVETEAGPVYNETKMRYLAHFGSSSTTRRYFEMYNLMGDPSLTLPAVESTGLRVTPAADFEPEGQAGGPFTPASQIYTLENRSDATISYEVSNGEPWVTIDNTSGKLAPAATTTVTVSINSMADNFGNGVYSDSVSFVNTTTHDGDCVRDVSLSVGVPEPVYVFDMSTNPGWTTQGLWAYGQPTGAGGDYGGPDPSSGYTGNNVYGYNLNGDYENYLSEKHLTTTAMDCTDLNNVILKFRRWLGVEQPTYDHAYVRVSNNGSSWNTIWENGQEITDSSWGLQEFDISDIADGEPTVYVRWTMGSTDVSWQYCGWNIDDVEIWGVIPSPIIPGDLNGDGCVDLVDLSTLLSNFGTTSGASYEEGDVDGDGDVDLSDLSELLAHFGEGC